MQEFELIKKYFDRPHRHRQLHPLGNGDDAAITTIPTDQVLVTSIDTMVVGRHFLKDTSAYDIGYKALAVSLSDMAAMGAQPISLLLGLTLPKANTIWLDDFQQGLFKLLDQYDMDLIGGDTTQGPLTIATVVNGLTPKDQIITRNGAQVGDDIYVSGRLGDAAAALPLLLADKPCPKDLLMQLNRPTPRVELGLALRGVATSAIDVSDGLAADLTHILKASHCGAAIDFKNIPTRQPLEIALTGGDDFELCFTAPSAKTTQIQDIAQTQSLPLTKIGYITDDKQQTFDKHLKGYQHF